jgi:adenine-specific DNA methylase
MEKIIFASIKRKKIMCNFNNQSEETKMLIHLFMEKAAQKVGGMNFLLGLIEAMRTKRPSPLMLKECQIASNNTIIKWNKVVFKDKVDVIEQILVAHKEAQEKDFNILNEENKKKKKNITNMIRALSPIEFVVTPQNPNDGEGFSFQVFDVVDENNVKLNPIFVAMFFCTPEFTKRAIRYES